MNLFQKPHVTGCWIGYRYLSNSFQSPAFIIDTEMINGMPSPVEESVKIYVRNVLTTAEENIFSGYSYTLIQMCNLGPERYVRNALTAAEKFYFQQLDLT